MALRKLLCTGQRAVLQCRDKHPPGLRAPRGGPPTPAPPAPGGGGGGVGATMAGQLQRGIQRRHHRLATRWLAWRGLSCQKGGHIGTSGKHMETAARS